MMITADRKAVRLFRICVERAESNIGKSVFDFQPSVIQKALIAAEILNLLNTQDEDVPDNRIRQMAQQLDELLAEF